MSTSEVQILTEKYNTLQHDVGSLRQTAMLNSEDLRAIKYALLGNEEFNQIGLVQQLKDHKKKHIDLEKKITILEDINNNNKIHKYWLSGIASAIGGFIVWLGHLLTK